jgi:membrane-associated phospholipid phosphatase
VYALQATPWLNNFDFSVESFFSHLSLRFGPANIIVAQLSQNYFLRGGVLMILAWLALFDKHKPGKLSNNFELVIGATLMGAVGTLCARIMAHCLPFRSRPFTVSAFHFPALAWGIPRWGCFPSDHAVLFSTVACGILFASRRLGVIALGWVAVAICLPRLYLGIHWPTDVIAGCAMGVAFSYAVRLPAFRDRVRRTVLRWHETQPQAVLAMLFVWTLSIATLFDDVRNLGSAVLTVVKHG